MGTTIGRTQRTARSLVDRSSANYQPQGVRPEREGLDGVLILASRSAGQTGVQTSLRDPRPGLPLMIRVGAPGPDPLVQGVNGKHDEG